MTSPREPRLTLVCGGLGGARLAPWLAPRCRLTAIVNVADDLDFMGLRVCPDLDAVLYALAGQFDEDRGYGIRGDGRAFGAFAGRCGLGSWFQVGDRDLHTHVIRTEALRRGLPLSEVTGRLARALGVRARVLPATDDAVRTRVWAEGREVSFQDFFVRDGGARCSEVAWAGLEAAGPGPGVIASIEEADVVVIAESSPVASVLPVLGLPGVREALTRHPGPRVALSPILAEVRPATSVDRHHERARRALMGALGVAHDPAGVAGLYAGLVDLFLLDHRDRAWSEAVRARGAAPRCAELLDRSPASRAALADLLVGLAGTRATVTGTATGTRSGPG